MLVDDASTKEDLLRMVRRITSNAALRQDLLQEALVHLWLVEDHRPGQTRSWYLQSCKFHLQHYLASGRSVDSRKRRNGQVQFPDDDGYHESAGQAESENSFLALINAREIIELLSQQLKPREQAVLACLADGLGARDIARRLRISHPTVIKYRRKIAGLTMKLGISSPAKPPAAQPNGFKSVNGNKYPGISPLSTFRVLEQFRKSA
jgi:RNA polymerase sigma factor (sigma-70 family)